MLLPKQVSDVLTTARKWAHARNVFVDLTDRKSARPEQVEAAKRALFAAGNELFKAVQGFEKFLLSRNAKKQSTKSSFDWTQLFGVVAKGAQFLEGVSKSAKAPNIIDVQGEEV